VNAIRVIVPYKYEGLWVFDDASVGLEREPFVSGADRIVERLAEGADRVALMFSATPFPGALRLEWRREEYGGNWYYLPDFNMEGWLCPALLKYFDAAPKELFVIGEVRKWNESR